MPEPPILTPELIALGEAAISTYELLRSALTAGLPPHVMCSTHPKKSYFLRHFTQESDHPPSLLSSLSCEGIERYYNALVDAKEAIRLRRLAITIDIGECLKVLDSKLKLYRKDGVFLSSAAYEVQLVKAESQTRQLGINFFALEMCRSQFQDPHYGASLLERNSHINTYIGMLLQVKEDVRQATYLFVDDPFALTEHRLPPFNSVQR